MTFKLIMVSMINLGPANQMHSGETELCLEKARGRELILLERILVFKLWQQFLQSDRSVQYVVHIYLSRGKKRINLMKLPS